MDSIFCENELDRINWIGWIFIRFSPALQPGRARRTGKKADKLNGRTQNYADGIKRTKLPNCKEGYVSAWHFSHLSLS